MKLNNWLVYSFAKNALFFLSFVIVGFAVVELVSVFFGYSLTLNDVNGIHLTWITDTVAPATLGKRLLYMMPAVIVFIVAAYCLLQVAMLLQNIRSGFAFRHQSFRKLSKIGIAILLTNFLLIIFRILQLPFITGPRNDISEALIKDQPAFSLIWVLIGCICLLLAHAFKTGFELQQQVDSYV